MIQELFESWIAVLTKPSEATFDAQQPKADLTKAVVGVLIAGVVSGVISAILVLIFGAAGVLGGGGIGSAAAGVAGAIFSLIFTPIFAVVGVLVGSAILLAFARIFGGTGTYTVQTYLISLFYAPLSIVTTIFGRIPILGALISLAVGIYEIVLITWAIKSTHRVTTGRAVLIWLVPGLIIGVIVLGCVAVAGLALLGLSS